MTAPTRRATTPALLALFLVTRFAVDIQTERRNESKTWFQPAPAFEASVRIAARSSEGEVPVGTGGSQAKGRQSEQRSTTSVGLEEVTMGTVLALSSPEFPVRALGSTGTVQAQSRSTAAQAETSWLTATIPPAGTFGRNDTSRLRALLDALSACASIVVLDLQVAGLQASAPVSPKARSLSIGSRPFHSARPRHSRCSASQKPARPSSPHR